MVTGAAAPAWGARVLCMLQGSGVLLTYRLPAGLPAGTITIERTHAGSSVVVRVAGGGLTTEGDYEVEDSDVAAGVTYTYTVVLEEPTARQVLGNGTIEV